jgi:Tol biopolymer transport system component
VIYVRCLALCALVVSLSCACGAKSARPDLRGVAYVRYVGEGRTDVWLAPLDGLGRKRLIARRADRPLVSPDGRWVAFAKCVAADYCGDVHIASTDGAERRLLARGVEAGAWTPDSNSLIGWRPLRAFRRGLVRIDVGDGTSTRLVDRPVETFSISPSGEEICVEINRRGRSDLYVVSVDGGDMRRLTQDGLSGFPVWGTRGIAFSRQVRGGQLPNNAWGADEIWSIDREGRARRRIARPPARILGSGITGLAPVAWSRDGRRLVAALLNEFGGRPYAVNTRTGAVRRIDSYGYDAWPSGLSRDGRSVLVEERSVELDRRWRVEVVPYSDGRPDVVARFAGSPSWNG